MTAELAITLPAVTLVLLVAISALGMQMTRIELSSKAAYVSRAIARDEPPELVANLLAQDETMTQKTFADIVCVTLSRPTNLLSAGITLSADSCARIAGL